ncbi:MAG TPA: cyclodeaminase/cyclohydrolase family protein [Pseudonocardiaceae bacterium]|nr:cyclodeaminase/cyclohydrolase family protein [Pseudonocardiaceae bacterium]
MIPARNAPLLDCSVKDLLDRLAAKQPAPGAGVAAAITAAMAAGLLGMAARFSTAQLNDSVGRAVHADRVRDQIAALAEQEAEAYQAVLAAFALPSELDSEVRRRQIRRTLERASRVPTEIAEAASGIAIEAVELAERGNPNLRGDAVTAATLAAAAARSAAELVWRNVELGDLGSELAERAAAAATIAANAVAILDSHHNA